MSQVINIYPYQYVHVIETNTNITRLEIGPQTLVLLQNERLQKGPLDMEVIPPNFHAIVGNPVALGEDDKPIMESFGQVKIRRHEREVRTHLKYGEPFPLYPGEKIIGDITRDYVISKKESILVEILEDYTADNGTQYITGDLLIVQGPTIFVPRAEQMAKEIRKGQIIRRNEAIQLTAERGLIDDEGTQRLAGEQWLFTKRGLYRITNPYIKINRRVSASILGKNLGYHIRALKAHTDFMGVSRKAGEIWLVTQEDATSFFINSEIQSIENEIQKQRVSAREYCVILNPVETDPTTKQIKQRFGGKKLIKGPASFFLQPGEELENGGPTKIYVLSEDQSLLLFAQNEFVDQNGIIRRPGEKWLFEGIGEYIPPTDAKVLELRESIPLSKSEGIYIKDEDTGEVRAHIGSTYILKSHESLYKKELDSESERLFATESLGIPYIPPKIVNGKLVYELPDVSNYVRDKSRVISYKVSANRTVQLFNFKTKETNVVFGPALVQLLPEEILTLLRLSGGNPKKENSIQTFSLMLGPALMSDTVKIETSDHAQIELMLSYKWHFDYENTDPKSERNKKLFSTRDFIGDVCKTISSRIRGSVSAISYDDFHHKSAYIIRAAVFGKKKDGNLKESLRFSSNNLVVTSCDIKSQKPVEKDIEEKLKKNTFLAISIKTNAMKMEFQHKTSLLEQESKGELDLKKLEDNKRAEIARVGLLKKIAEKESIISVGLAVANAKAQTEKDEIISQNKVNLVKADCEKIKIETEAKLALKKKAFHVAEQHQKAMADLRVAESKALSEVEVSRLNTMIGALGSETLVQMLKAGPEQQAEMLKALGLKGYLMTDGKNPINLFDTASGLVQGQQLFNLLRIVRWGTWLQLKFIAQNY